jgi:PAS domain S-box-containing protein
VQVMTQEIEDKWRSIAEQAVQTAEARIKLVLENTPFGVAVISADGIVEATNPALETMSGFSAHELAGMKATDLFVYDGTAQQFLERVQQCAIGNIALAQLRCRDLTHMPVEFTGKFFQTPTIKAVLLSIQDGAWKRTVL